MQLHPSPLEARDMTRHGNDLIVEASTIGFRKLEQLYDDACDVGVVLRSPRTGAVVRWYLTEEVKDGEGDVLEWKFKPCSESVYTNPSVRDCILRIAND